MANSLSTETELPELKVKPLLKSAVQMTEYRNNNFTAVIERGTTKEMVTLSSLWSIVSDQFHSYDRVCAIWSDRSAYAELLVIDSGRGYCSMILLSYHPLPALLVSEAGLPPGFDIYFAGPVDSDNGGYCVKRLVDGVIMVKGKHNRADALAELLESATLR